MSTVLTPFIHHNGRGSIMLFFYVFVLKLRYDTRSELVTRRGWLHLKVYIVNLY